ncbi:speckle-type POZ protein B [Trichonephila clavata]|uniref:Speckle-type POZ protein B n=1 Tax=Trichonephila clavata TaxID=2740835 RepID=A0A8X6L2U0_TRICU|nr:speckle-type POZ protein B [Trichonephila clavata]
MACNAKAEDEPWLTIFWNIENYSYYGKKRDECVSSPTFRVESIEKSTWVLSLYPLGRRDVDFITFKLYGSLSDTSKVIEVEFEVAILAEDGSVLEIIERKGTCLYKSGSPRCFDAFALREEVINTKRQIFLPRDTFRTRCRLWKTVGKVEAPFTIFGRTALKEERRNVIGSFENFSSLYVGKHIDLSIDKSASTEPSFTLRMHHDNKIKISASFVDMGVTYFTIQAFIRHTDGHETAFEYNPIIPNPCISNAEASQLKSIPGLKEDFECLYSKGILSDVKLHTASESFQVHKVILAARSPVFLAIFTTDMKEKIQECVDVSDLEDDTVRRMLLYLYTDTLKDLQWENTLKLYYAADKYQIIALKVKCCSFLKRNLCPSNVCDMLVLADLHGDGELKNSAQEYALAHEKDVFSSDEWTKFAKNNAVLASETMLCKWRKTSTDS